MFVLVERALEGMAQNYVPASGSGAIKAGGGFEFVERVLEAWHRITCRINTPGLSLFSGSASWPYGIGTNIARKRLHNLWDSFVLDSELWRL
jgi:hypothetical protein